MEGGQNLNFKELYKAANDSIAADRELIDKVFKKSDKKIFVFNYKYASLCAAALLLVISIGVFQNLNSEPISKDNSKQIVHNENKGSAKPEVNKMKASDTFEKDDMKEENDKEEQQDDVDPEKEEKSQKSKMILFRVSEATGNTAPGAVDSVEINDQNDKKQNVYSHSTKKNKTKKISDVPMVAMTTDSDDASPSNNSTFSAGGSAAMADMSEKPEYWSCKEYSDYLGIDINVFFEHLPNNLKINTPESVTVYVDGNDAVTDDYAQFVTGESSNSKGYISVATGKISDINKKTGKSENQKVNGYNVNFIYSADGFINAYYKKNDVWVSICAQGVDKDDFVKYVASTLN